MTELKFEEWFIVLAVLPFLSFFAMVAILFIVGQIASAFQYFFRIKEKVSYILGVVVFGLYAAFVFVGATILSK